MHRGGARGAVVVVVAVVMLVTGCSAYGNGPVGGGGGPLDPAGIPSAFVPFLQQAGGRYCSQVTPAALAGQDRAESGWNPHARSSAGADGLAQFTPGTWATWGRDADHNGTSSPFDPGDAIDAQARFMCALVHQMAAAKRSGLVSGNVLDLAWAGYNAGPGAVLAFGGVPPYPQTQQYVVTVRRFMTGYQQLPPGGSGGGGGGAGGGAEGVVAAAKLALGLPYVWGGGDYQGPTGGGFDCSGLVMFAVARATGGKVQLLHSSRADRTTGKLQVVPGGAQHDLAVLRPGDIIVINIPGSGDGPWGHVGIYAGNGMILHAPRPGKDVQIVSLTGAFGTDGWAVRRVPAADLVGSPK